MGGEWFNGKKKKETVRGNSQRMEWNEMEYDEEGTEKGDRQRGVEGERRGVEGVGREREREGMRSVKKKQQRETVDFADKTER